MKIKLLTEDAHVPTKATEQAAGFDLYVPTNTIVNPGRNIVPLNIALAIPRGLEGQIRPRSGFSAKGIEGYSYVDENSINDPRGEAKRYDADVLLGTIDSDYRGNVGVLIKSNESEPFIVAAGTRIAQLVIAPYSILCMEPTTSLDDTERGDGGYGHTGVK